MKPQESGIKIITENRKARFEYEILEKFEAGIVLSGAEIKSVRLGHVNISEGYVAPYQDEMFLLGVHIGAYSHSGDKEYDPIRNRKLLLHKAEIDKLRGRVETKGLTIVPLKLYLKRGKAKIEIGLARGKAHGDKRESIKKREAEREMARVLRGKPKDRGRGR